jgi:hypothetical protein
VALPLLVVHLSSLVQDGGRRCSDNGAGAGLRLDHRVLRCRTAWMSESLAGAAALTAQIRRHQE